jgi:uncharacterized protein
MIGDGPYPRVRAAHWLVLAYAVVFASLIAFAAGIALFGDPHAGDPVVRIAMNPTPVVRHRAVVVAPPPVAPVQAPEPGPAVPPAQTANAQPPAQTTTAPAPAPPAAPPVAAPLPPAVAGKVADPALIEKTPQGPLPRIADNGMTPLRAYAPPVVAEGKPRIAIVISGLGISAKATQAAIDGLPAGVTLAFLPYANDVQHWVTLARQKGHEVLLEVPMEAYDFPDSDSGEYTLRTGAGEDANTQRLVWSLTRITGYVGVTNLLGGRLLSDDHALEPMLAYMARRGLMFFDNGTTAHSVAPDVAARVGVPFVQATEPIDLIQAAMEIDHKLSDLEGIARTNGSASGSGFIYPVTIDRVSQWARGLPGRGLVLAPVSAIVSQPKK